MHRFTLAAGLTLLFIPADPAPKPKPPAISVCYGGLVGLHWARPTESGRSLPSIAGALVNNSANTLSSVSVTFSLASAETLTGTAMDIFVGQIPPGASWAFKAFFRECDGSAFITRIDSGVLTGLVITMDGTRPFSQAFHFDPVFSPSNWKERNEWEKVYGSRNQ